MKKRMNLIEVLIVVIIFGTLGGIVLPPTLDTIDKINEGVRVLEEQGYKTKLEAVVAEMEGILNEGSSPEEEVISE